MGRSMNSDEIRLELIHDMGEDLGSVFHHLRNRLLDCFLLWLDYKTLYFDKQEHIEILNDAAPYFFGRIQRIIQDKVILDLCKLADPAGVKKKGEEYYNISYNRVMELVNETIQEDLTDINSKIESAISDLRQHRNKRIGHNDLATAEQIRKNGLKNITIKAIDEVFHLMQEAFNKILKHYQDATTPFHFMKGNPSAEGLLYVLYDGLEHYKERQERFFSHTHTEADMNRRKLRL